MENGSPIKYRESSSRAATAIKRLSKLTAMVVRHATLESEATVPSSTVAKIIKEISVDVPPLRPRRSKNVALCPGVATRGAAGKHLPRHSYFFFPSRSCRKKVFQTDGNVVI
ncbi:unnamed protein product [Leptosia nina]|uniref:Uncharacterized protein n=1 Tax=Leptosia nina TaxID=320188 RepID=A0AAV1J769_9NEOP